MKHGKKEEQEEIETYAQSRNKISPNKATTVTAKKAASFLVKVFFIALTICVDSASADRANTNTTATTFVAILGE